MSVSDAEIAFAKDLFADLGTITGRKMMGGLTLYANGQIFAVLRSNGTPYLKAKDAFAAEMQAAGSCIFAMDDGRSMGYWTLPEAALDDPELACTWARRALSHLE